MRIEIHHRIGISVCSELKYQGCKINKNLFLFGNLFPDLIHSYIWCRHEYKYSREYVKRKLEILKKRPILFSFHLGILTHYISDYFCYPHTESFDKGLVEHIAYEIRQKIPLNFNKMKLNIRTFSIEELDRFVKWYNNFRASVIDDELDFHIATIVASNFLHAAF